MDLVQSYLFSISRVKLSLYEQRILVKVVEQAQVVIKGLPLAQNLKPLNNLPDNVRIEIPVKVLLNGSSEHYHQVYDAARSLMSRRFEYLDPVDETWYAATIINNVQVKKRSGVLCFYVAKILFDVILDFRQGFRVVDLQTLLTLPSPSAARLYAIMMNQKTPITMKLSTLKKMFGVEDKYKQSADFIKRVLVPAKECLDKAQVDSFTFAPVKEGQKVTAVTLFPNPVFKTFSQMREAGEINPTAYQQIRLIMKQYCGFVDKELENVSKILRKFSTMPECVQTCYQICHRATKVDNPKAYVVGSIKLECHIISK